MQQHRLQFTRSMATVILVLTLAGAASAAPRDDRGRSPREISNPIVKAVKKIIRVLGTD